MEPNWTVEDQLRKTQNKRNHRRVHSMFNKSKPGRHKIYAGLAGVAALALVTACTAEEPAQEDQPADQETEQQDTNAPAEEETTATENDTADSDDASGDATESGEASGDDEVYSIIDAVEAEYSNGFIVDIDREDDGSTYEVDVVADNEVHQLDVTADGTITVDETDTDDDDIREAEQATVTVAEALDEAFSQHADARFDQIQLDEDDGSIHWEVDFEGDDDEDIELEVPAT